MEYLPAERRRGPSGEAKVLFGKRITVTMKDTGLTRELDVPDFLEGKKLPSGNYFVSLSADETKLYAVRPLNETVVVKFVRWAGRENQVPTPKYVTGVRERADGTKYPVDEMTCTAICVITRGPLADIEIVVPFLYSRKDSGFVEDKGNVSYRGGGKKGEMMVSFLEATGVFQKTIPFSDNLLPILAKLILEEDREFMVVLRAGWPDSISVIPSHLMPSKAKSAKKTTSTPTKSGKKK